MLISYIHYPVKTLGPGTRMGIWTSGCLKSCKGCMSLDNKSFDPSRDKDVKDILNQVKEVSATSLLDGVTISGGEPFLQKDLPELVKGLKELGIKDILVYTGYLYEEIKDNPSLQYIDVLIDGPYMEELNDNGALRGSSNQKIYIFNKEVSNIYKEYLSHTPRQFDMLINDGTLAIIGIMPRGGHDRLDELLGIKK